MELYGTTVSTNAIGDVYEAIAEAYQDKRFELTDELSEIHNKVFNQEFFVIGYYRSKKWIEKVCGMANAVKVIQNYEGNTIGEIVTDLANSIAVGNKLASIIGNMVLFEAIKELKEEN